MSDKVSIALIAEQPFGSDIVYDGSATTTMLGGTSAVASSASITALGRYKFTDRFSAHAGLRYQTIEGDISLSGLSYAGLNGYKVSLSAGEGFGYVVGGAFEIPEYKARIALTYNSEISHDLGTVETVNGVAAFGVSPDTTVKTPASINLDFQTGINPKTLVFGSVRYAKWSDFKIAPKGFDASVNPGTAGDSISSLEDTWAYTVGVGRQVTDNFAATVAVGFEPKGTDDLVSPLAPTNGNWSVSLGGRYTIDNVVLSGGLTTLQNSGSDLTFV